MRALSEHFQSTFRADPEQFRNSSGTVLINLNPFDSVNIKMNDVNTPRAVSEQFQSSFSAIPQ